MDVTINLLDANDIVFYSDSFNLLYYDYRVETINNKTHNINISNVLGAQQEDKNIQMYKRISKELSEDAVIYCQVMINGVESIKVKPTKTSYYIKALDDQKTLAEFLHIEY